MRLPRQSSWAGEGRTRQAKKLASGHDMPGSSTRKRHRSDKKDEDTADEAVRESKVRKVQVKREHLSLHTQGHDTDPTASVPLRRSLRLQNLQRPDKQPEKQRLVTIKRRKQQSFVPAEVHDHNQIRDKSQRASTTKAAPNKSGVSEGPRATIVERQRNIVDEQNLTQTPKRLKCHHQNAAEVTTEQEKYIEHWLEEQLLTDFEEYEADAMSRNPINPPSWVGTTKTGSTKASERAAIVQDTGYRRLLGDRCIYIEQEDPPVKVMDRARQIVLRERASPGMDTITVQKTIRKSRSIQSDGEDVIVKQLATTLIPAMSEIPHQHLAMNSDLPWSASVALPLDPSVWTDSPKLPKPKPDVAFGYANSAFTRDQLTAIRLLIDGESGQSYAVPDHKLHFPFLCIEFKSQAKSGTLYVARNQAAGAGAIAMNGGVELMRRCSSEDNCDYDEPKFFSVTMDSEVAYVNVHWLKAPVNRGRHSFHMELLSQHFMRNANDIQTFVQAVKNILDYYGAEEQLHALRQALDVYYEIVVRDRIAANSTDTKPGTKRGFDQMDTTGAHPIFESWHANGDVSIGPNTTAQPAVRDSRHKITTFKRQSKPSRKVRDNMEVKR